MRRVVCLIGAALGLVCGPSAHAATNLLSNGSFENGLTGWTVTNSGTTTSNAVVASYNSTAAYPVSAYGESVAPDNNASNPAVDASGSKFLYFSTDTGSQSLAQTVTLTAGHTYSFGFDYYLPQNGYNNQYDFSVSINFSGFNVSTINGSSVAAKNWYTSSVTQTISSTMSGNLALVFSGAAPANGLAKDVAIDRIYLIDKTPSSTSVPEPATWAMMLVGFGVVGAAMRRRDRRVARI